MASRHWLLVAPDLTALQADLNTMRVGLGFGQDIFDDAAG